jgi:hypothetical protein
MRAATSSDPRTCGDSPDAGYRDNGAPGERAVYYGAYVLDPDGHNVEVVDHNR